MPRYYYRFSDGGETEECLLDPTRETCSWNPAYVEGYDVREGVSVTTGITDLLAWAYEHDAIIDDADLVVLEGVELGDDMDNNPDVGINAVRIRPTHVVEIVPVSYESIMDIASRYDESDPWYLTAVSNGIDALGIE